VPKLTATQVKAVEKVTPQLGDAFEPHEVGKYIGALREVEAKLSANGNPMWSISWDKLRTLEGEEIGGRMFTNLNFPTSKEPKPDWKPNDPKRLENWTKYQERCKAQIHGFFLAHGYTPDSDTDEMLGEDCILDIGIETQQAGKGAGKRRNVVNGWSPLDAAAAEAAGAGDDADGDDDEF
jgi:hypothetical protein